MSLTPRISLWPHNHSRPRNPRHTATCTKSFFRHLRRGLCPPTSFSPRPLPKLRPFGFLLSLPRAFLPPLVRRSVLPASLLAVQSSALNPLPLPLRPVLRGGWNPLLVRILSRSAPTCLRCSEKTPLPAPRSGAGVVHIYNTEGFRVYRERTVSGPWADRERPCAHCALTPWADRERTVSGP